MLIKLIKNLFVYKIAALTLSKRISRKFEVWMPALRTLHLVSGSSRDLLPRRLREGKDLLQNDSAHSRPHMKFAAKKKLLYNSLRTWIRTARPDFGRMSQSRSHRRRSLPKSRLIPPKKAVFRRVFFLLLIFLFVKALLLAAWLLVNQRSGPSIEVHRCVPVCLSSFPSFAIVGNFRFALSISRFWPTQQSLDWVDQESTVESRALISRSAFLPKPSRISFSAWISDGG